MISALIQNLTKVNVNSVAAGVRRDDLAVHVKREHVFEDSFRELLRRTADDWKHRFYIVFEGTQTEYPHTPPTSVLVKSVLYVKELP